MKLFNYRHYEDYGHEWYFQLLPFCSRFAVLDVVVQWDEFPTPELFPMLVISFGSISLTGFSFRWKWLEIRCNFLITWPRKFD